MTTTENETLLGRTTRRVTFIDKGNPCRMVGKPRNTYVYATALRNGLFRIRIPQTLLEQDVSLSSVEPV